MMTRDELLTAERRLRQQLSIEVSEALDRLTLDAYSRRADNTPPRDFVVYLAQARAYYTARILVHSILIKEPH